MRGAGREGRGEGREVERICMGGMVDIESGCSGMPNHRFFCRDGQVKASCQTKFSTPQVQFTLAAIRFVFVLIPLCVFFLTGK